MTTPATAIAEGADKCPAGYKMTTDLPVGPAGLAVMTLGTRQAWG